MSSRLTFFQSLANSNILFFGFWISIIGLIGQWVLTGVYYWQLPPQVPLLYSLPYGKAQLVEKQWFLLLPILSTCFWLMNLLMMRMFREAHVLIRQMTVWTTCLIIWLLVIAQVYLIFLVL